ncbi:hypothetical protein GXB85_04045 [Cellulomonas sp. APG4]|uniref:hypothetical protein n=1 Tax=Cellulomonas sp. APG4 TaxID=1538656 RepID=UPI00137A0158|nr:hypothetical protein [Cellulomonas sp. APG4]NCT90126.1 hypothetical protein [Cellulomonas sp. APG4]
MKTVYLSHETHDALTTMAKLLGVSWASFARSILDAFVNQTVEQAENAAMLDVNDEINSDDEATEPDDEINDEKQEDED